MSGYHPRSEDTGVDGFNKKRRMSEMALNPHSPPPSRVVHARAVPDGTLSTDMHTILGVFGKISHVMLMPALRQALIEFEDVKSAVRCVNESKESGVLIRDRPVYFNFSKSQEINRGQSDNNSKPNKVLLFTIQNALYPITCDVIQAICQPISNVVRIVMVRKRGVQALVEFENAQAAAKVRQSLNFQDIYAGCCTLKIEFSRTDQLNVTMNSDDTRDFSNPSLPTRQNSHMSSSNQAPLLNDTRTPHGGAGTWNGSDYAMRNASMAMDPWTQQQQQQQQLGAYRGSFGAQGMGQMGQVGFHMAGSVIMFYELSTHHFNCQRLFNLVCLYANPIKVKFIVNKPGMAMVQVDDPYAAQVVIDTLQGLEVFGQKIECGPSKHAFIADSRNTARLADGSPHTLDCSRSMNHRFNSSRQSRGPQSGPTPVLHFFNAPKDTPHQTIIDVFKDHQAPAPTAILTLKPKDPTNTKSDRGFVEFANSSDAVHALIICNHVEIQSSRGQVFTVKFAFSKNKIDETDPSATRLASNNDASSATTTNTNTTNTTNTTSSDSISASEPNDNNDEDNHKQNDEVTFAPVSE